MMNLAKSIRFAGTAIAASAVILGLSACSTTDAGSAPVETKFDSAAVLEGYFTALNTNSPETAKEASEFSSAGSNAEAYAIEQTAHIQARMDGGVPLDEEREILFEEDTVLYCFPGYDEPDVDRMDFCQGFSNFEFEGGKLANFNAGASSLDGRIVLGDPAATALGTSGEARVISSYETIMGDLVIILEVKATGGSLELPYDASYITPEGRQTEVYATEGVNSLSDGRIGNVAYIFAGASIGGTIELEFYDADYNSILVSFPTE